MAGHAYFSDTYRTPGDSWPTSRAAGGRTTFRLVQALAMQASLRDMISLRSNSAMPDMMVMTSLPTSEVASHHAPPSDTKPHEPSSTRQGR